MVAVTRRTLAAAGAVKAPVKKAVPVKKAKKAKAVEQVQLTPVEVMSPEALLLFAAVFDKLDVGKMLRANNDLFLSAWDSGEVKLSEQEEYSAYCNDENEVCVGKDEGVLFDDDNEELLMGFGLWPQSYVQDIKDARDIAEYNIELRFVGDGGCLRPASLAFFFTPDGKLDARREDLTRVLREMCAELMKPSWNET